jgi:hypothetical protein
MDIKIVGNKEAAEAIIYLTERWDRSVAKCDSDSLTNEYFASFIGTPADFAFGRTLI